MADTTTDNETEATGSDADTLASAVDALIDEIEGVCEAFDKSRADDAPSPSEPRKPQARASAPSEADASLDAAVDAVVAESVGAEDDADTDARGADDDGASEAEPAPENEAPASDDSIDDLDAELAAAADEELAGDLATMDDLDGEAVTPESLAREAESEPALAPAAQAAPKNATPAPKAAPKPAPTSESAPEPVAEEVASPEPARARWSWVAPVVRVLTAPLSRLTAMQRDTIGWVALNTLFLAVCVWVFVLLR